MPDVRLIDANALLETICKKCPEYDCKPDATDTVSGCLIYDVVASSPTIDAQPVKRGKWRKRMSTQDSVKCCLCGYASVQESSYCGGCGAFMRGDNDVG